jgi:uncharacterized low-complexity protein
LVAAATILAATYAGIASAATAPPPIISPKKVYGFCRASIEIAGFCGDRRGLSEKARREEFRKFNGLPPARAKPVAAAQPIVALARGDKRDDAADPAISGRSILAGQDRQGDGEQHFDLRQRLSPAACRGVIITQRPPRGWRGCR